MKGQMLDHIILNVRSLSIHPLGATLWTELFPPSNNLLHMRTSHIITKAFSQQ